MAPLVLLSGFVFLFGVSLADVAPFLGCGFSDRQVSPTERIRNFLDCLRDQGHDEELLAELKRSFEGQPTPRPQMTSSCPPEGGFDEKGRFPYCSGMMDLQCRTLILVLESLLSVPASSQETGDASSFEKTLRDPSLTPQDSAEEDEVQAALMNVILARFNDILDEYKRWRVEHASRQKRSDHPHVEGDNVDKSTSTSGQKVEPPEVADKSKPEARASFPMRMRGLRMRRQAAPALPFKFPDKLTPEMQAMLEGYLTWREKNGYGKMSGRWG